MDDAFREVRCRHCEAVFHLCRRHDRGQTYCKEACRSDARTIQKRVARSAHQRSALGREDHRDRMRDHRARGRVTDQGSEKLAQGATVCRDVAPVSMPDTPARRVEGADDVLATALLFRPDTGHPRCAVCQRAGRFIRVHYLAWGRRTRPHARIDARPP
jgi:hypothetical protein